MSAHTSAKRGDLVALVRTQTTTAADFTRTTRERVELARVTSVTREGVIKLAVRPDGGHAYRNTVDIRVRPLIVPASTIDVDAALTAYSARRYPTAPTSPQVPPFDDLQAARAFLAPFRTSTQET